MHRGAEERPARLSGAPGTPRSTATGGRGCARPCITKIIPCLSRFQKTTLLQKNRVPHFFWISFWFSPHLGIPRDVSRSSQNARSEEKISIASLTNASLRSFVRVTRIVFYTL